MSKTKRNTAKLTADRRRAATRAALSEQLGKIDAVIAECTRVRALLEPVAAWADRGGRLPAHVERWNELAAASRRAHEADYSAEADAELRATFEARAVEGAPVDALDTAIEDVFEAALGIEKEPAPSTAPARALKLVEAERWPWPMRAADEDGSLPEGYGKAYREVAAYVKTLEARLAVETPVEREAFVQLVTMPFYCSTIAAACQRVASIIDLMKRDPAEIAAIAFEYHLDVLDREDEKKGAQSQQASSRARHA